MKRILVPEPGGLHPCQGRLNYDAGKDLHHYIDAPVRRSTLGPGLVLDVRSIIVAPDPLDGTGLVILEGHTRSCEAARQHVGIEAYLLQKEQDAYRLPKTCSAGFSISPERAAYNFREREHYRKRTLASGTVTIHDLMKFWYSPSDEFLAKLRAEREEARAARSHTRPSCACVERPACPRERSSRDAGSFLPSESGVLLHLRLIYGTSIGLRPTISQGSDGE